MFRSIGKSKIAIVLAILFGLSLFFIRGSTRYSNFFNSDSVVANVSSTQISTTKFNRTMKMNIDNFNEMLGKPMSGDEIRSFQIHTLALGALINDAVFEDEFDKIYLKIDEKVIAQKTKDRIPQLYDQNNQLNENFLNSFLQQQKLKIEDIVQIINFETRDKYFTDAFFQLNYPKYFSKKIQSFDNHERQTSIIKINLKDINIETIKSNYSDNLDLELQKFYEKNINNYIGVEKRDVEFIVIDKTLLNEKFNPSDFEIKEYYDQNKNLFLENEKRSFVQFNFKSNKEALNFKEIIQNKKLEEIINYSKNNNIKYNQFINLEKVEILDTIANPLFNLKVEEQSEIIESTLAKHIVILESVQKSNQPKFEGVKNKIKNIISDVETNNYYNDLLVKISDNVLNGSSIDEIGNNFNFKKKSIIDLTRDYNDYNKSEELLIKNIIETSFNSTLNFVSDPININENLSLILNVKKINLAKPIEFNKIKKKILDDWENFQKVNLISEQVKINSNNLNFFNQLSTDYKKQVDNILISKNSKDIPQKIINQIFNTDINKNKQSIHNKDIYIFSVSKIIFLNNSNKENADIEIPLINDLKSIFGQELMKQKKISTNENLINALIDQY